MASSKFHSPFLSLPECVENFSLFEETFNSSLHPLLFHAKLPVSRRASVVYLTDVYAEKLIDYDFQMFEKDWQETIPAFNRRFNLCKEIERVERIITSMPYLTLAEVALFMNLPQGNLFIDRQLLKIRHTTVGGEERFRPSDVCRSITWHQPRD